MISGSIVAKLGRRLSPEHPALERRIQREKRANQPPPPATTDEMLESMEAHPDFGQENKLIIKKSHNIETN